MRENLATRCVRGSTTQKETGGWTVDGGRWMVEPPLELGWNSEARHVER